MKPLNIILSFTLSYFMGASFALGEQDAKDSSKNGVPHAFTINCAACHLTDRVQVGPHFVYLQEKYPKTRRKQFIEWCKNPGKNNPEMPQMPSMVHVPDEELAKIHDYILSVEVKSVRQQAGDLFKDTRRPRIIRTFLPDCGPSALLVALPLDNKLNLVWDADLCRLRYLTTGEPDNYPYLSGNGNNLSKPGTEVYTEDSVFKADAKVTFQGYKINDGLPTFHYQVDGIAITEKLSVSDDALVRTITSATSLPPLDYQAQPSSKVDTRMEQSTQSVTLTHSLK